MAKKTPRPVRGEAGKKSQTTDPQHKDFSRARQTSLSVPALAEFRERLVVARARHVERIILEYDPAHQYPGTAWVRMVSDLHTTIMAMTDMIKECQK